jgi:hypothetical protein
VLLNRRVKAGGSALPAVLCCALLWAATPATGQRPTEAPTANASGRRDARQAAPLRVVLFYSTACEGCARLIEALPSMARRWGNRIVIEQRDTDDARAVDDLLGYVEHYGVEVKRRQMVVFVGGQALVGTRRIVPRLQEAISAELARGSATFSPAAQAAPGAQAEAPAAADGGEGPPPPRRVVDHFRSFDAGAVAVAGLLDGVNPCAMTTVVFLLSMLALLGKGKRELAAVGVGFTAAVFATYVLLGLGLFGAVKAFSVRRGISTGLTIAVGVLALVLAAWSLADFVRYVRSGDVRTVTLGLPKPVKQRIRKVIRVGLSSRALVVASIGVGVLVALLESLCTGQVYLPTIVLVARSPGLRAHAVAYLLLYNLMFIAPLVGVLVVACCGVGSQRLGELLRRHLGAIKLALAALFAALGVLVLATV